GTAPDAGRARGDAGCADRRDSRARAPARVGQAAGVRRRRWSAFARASAEPVRVRGERDLVDGERLADLDERTFARADRIRTGSRRSFPPRAPARALYGWRLSCSVTLRVSPFFSANEVSLRS